MRRDAPIKTTLNPSGITLRELEILRLVMESGTATAAAELLGISQPAVSRAVTHMEGRLGRALFLREGGRLVPTDTARVIDAELDLIFAALTRIESDSGPQPDPQVPIRVVAPPTIGHRFMPGVVADFARKYPDQQMMVDVLSSDILATHVAEGRANLGITDSIPNHAGIRLEPFHESTVVCLMRRDHPLAARKIIGPDDLDDVDFVTLTRRHSVRAANDGALARTAAQPRARIEAATAVLASELVVEGLGVALINPFPTALRLNPLLCMRAFRPRITLHTCFMSPAGTRLSAAALAFMDIARAHARQIKIEGSPE